MTCRCRPDIRVVACLQAANPQGPLPPLPYGCNQPRTHARLCIFDGIPRLFSENRQASVGGWKRFVGITRSFLGFRRAITLAKSDSRLSEFPAESFDRSVDAPPLACLVDHLGRFAEIFERRIDDRTRDRMEIEAIPPCFLLEITRGGFENRGENRRSNREYRGTIT